MALRCLLLLSPLSLLSGLELHESQPHNVPDTKLFRVSGSLNRARRKSQELLRSFAVADRDLCDAENQVPNRKFQVPKVALHRTHRATAFLSSEGLTALVKHAKSAAKWPAGHSTIIHNPKDGQPGEVIGDMVLLKAVAKLYSQGSYRMEYGGAYPDFTGVKKHSKLMNAYGLPEPLTKLPDGAMMVGCNVADFVNVLELMPNATIYLDCENLRKEFLQYYTDKNSTMPTLPIDTSVRRFPTANLWSSKASVSVAIHIRRGSIMRNFDMDHLLPNSYYIAIMDQIKSLMPGAEFVIFSQKPFGCDVEGYRASDFAERDDIIMQLDSDLFEAWSHMSQADVLITSRSQFSHVPALFNGGLVIDAGSTKDAHDSLESWISTDGTEAGVKEIEFWMKLQKKLKELPI